MVSGGVTIRAVNPAVTDVADLQSERNHGRTPETPETLWELQKSTVEDPRRKSTLEDTQKKVKCRSSTTEDTTGSGQRSQRKVNLRKNRL